MVIPALKANEITRRAFLQDLLVMSGWALTGFCNAQPILQDDDVVKLAYLPVTDAAGLLTAHALGYFEQEGLRVAPPLLVNSWAQLTQKFLAGECNLVSLLVPIPIWLRYSHKLPIKIVSWAHLNGSAIVVGKETNIDNFSDLGGKQIGIPYEYSTHNVILQMVLRQVGLKPVMKLKYEKLAKNEVNLQVLSPPVMLLALSTHTLDAYTVAEPFNAQGEIENHAKVLRFTGDIWKNHPCCVVCMSENIINRKPEWAQKVVNAIVRAQIYAQQNKESVATLLSQAGRNYIPVSAEVLKRAMLDYDPKHYTKPPAIIHQSEWQNNRVDFFPWPYPSATRLLVDMMKKTVMNKNTQFLQTLEPDFVANDLVNYEFVRNALKNQTGWQTTPGVDPNNPFERQETVVL